MVFLQKQLKLGETPRPEFLEALTAFNFLQGTLSGFMGSVFHDDFTEKESCSACGCFLYQPDKSSGDEATSTPWKRFYLGERAGPRSLSRWLCRVALGHVEEGASLGVFASQHPIGDRHAVSRVGLTTNSRRISFCLYHLNIRSPRTDALHSQNLAWYLECPRYLGHVFQLNKSWIDGHGLTQKPSVSLLTHRPPLGYGTVATTMANEGNSWR